MKKTRFVYPFNTGYGYKRIFKERFRPGAYIIKKGKEILYIGFSGTDVIKTMYRHFYTWSDSQYRAVFNRNDKNIKVRVIYTNKAEQAAKLERALMIKYNPKFNYKTPTNEQADSKIISTYLNLTEAAPF